MGNRSDDPQDGFFSRPTEVVRGRDGGAGGAQGRTDLPAAPDAATVGPRDLHLRSTTDMVTGPPRPVSALDATTRLHRPAMSAADEAGNRGEHPVVGWLVVVEGPGRGQARSLTYGVNSIGRGPDAAIRLDFGDDEISRTAHCNIVYDGRNRKFFIQQGSGQNLTYLGDAPVLAPCELSADACISMGRTTLRFVPFCGSDFDWADAPKAG